MPTPLIIWTTTDEAPALASYSLLPILQRFLGKANITLKTRDISLAARILANFPDYLQDAQRVPDHLAELGQACLTPAINIIKLPNISASIPQLQDAIKELQAQGYALPDYPENPQNAAEKTLHARYAKVLGSAVNPVLREGNSDRRIPTAVKNFARKNPPALRAWGAPSKARVAHMHADDFYGNERSQLIANDDQLRIEFIAADGRLSVLKAQLNVNANDIVDTSFMRKKALCAFYAEQLAVAQQENLLWSLHLKATMMKVSDPELFGLALRVYFADFLRQHEAIFAKLGVNPNLGLADLLSRVNTLEPAQQAAIIADLHAVYATRPNLAMVDSDKGISNLHVPSDVIVDASMPVVIRDGGRMWNSAGELQETLALIPDRCYATIYAEVFADCQQHGAFDPKTMGSLPNIGLMAQQAEEYGSHNTTFILPTDGTVRVCNAAGETLFEHRVESGDIWRMCRTVDMAVQDWVRLAVARARLTGLPAVFWLDAARAHDAQLIAKVKAALETHDIRGLTLPILSPQEAMRFSLTRIRQGLDTIAVTGNVLRDYLTDLFPILELGTSAKMLSVVPLLAGGGLFETGAGGSAPKHVQQFLRENYLRWDSLGEFSALGASLEHLAQQFTHRQAQVLADTLDAAIAQFLDENKSPARKVGEIDNRGSHFYLALYWAKALAAQTEDGKLQADFAPLAKALDDNERQIAEELLTAQGNALDIGGYYHPDPHKTAAAMRPSHTFNALLMQFLS